MDLKSIWGGSWDHLGPKTGKSRILEASGHQKDTKKKLLGTQLGVTLDVFSALGALLALSWCLRGLS